MKKNYFIIALIIIAFFLNALQSSYAAGVAAIKKQSSDDDSSAKPLVFTEVKDQGAPFLKFTVNGKILTIDKAKVAALVQVPSTIPKQIINEKDIAPLKVYLTNMTNFAKRFPNMETIISKQIISVRYHIQNFDSGKLRVNDVWITKIDYDSKLKQNISQSADGSPMATNELETISGKKYTNYKLYGSDINGVKLLYSDGIADIKWNDIPDDFKAEFGYEEIVKKENERVSVLENKKKILREKIDKIITENRKPLKSYEITNNCREYQEASVALGEMPKLSYGEGYYKEKSFTSDHAEKLFGKPDSTEYVKRGISDDESNLPNLPSILSAIQNGTPKPEPIYAPVRIWYYNKRLVNSTSNELETLKLMFRADNMTFIGISNEDGFLVSSHKE